MKTYTKEEISQIFSKIAELYALLPELTEEQDNQGQCILYTGLFPWNDNTWRNQPEEE